MVILIPIQKLKEKINSIVFIDSSLLYLNSKNKLIIVGERIKLQIFHLIKIAV